MREYVTSPTSDNKNNRNTFENKYRAAIKSVKITARTTSKVQEMFQKLHSM